MKEINKDPVEIYKLAKDAYNKGNPEKSAELYRESAILFKGKGEIISAARATGRVAWNSIPTGKIHDVAQYLEESTELDYDQGTANFLYAACLFHVKLKNEEKSTKYLLRSISMLYNELKFSLTELKRQEKLVEKDVRILMSKIVRKFYKKKISEEKKLKYLDWVKSDKPRAEMILGILGTMGEDPHYYLKFSKSFQKAELEINRGIFAALYSLSQAKDKDEISEIRDLSNSASQEITPLFEKSGESRIQEIFKEIKEVNSIGKAKTLINEAIISIRAIFDMFSVLNNPDFEEKLKEEFYKNISMKINEKKLSIKKFIIILPIIFAILFFILCIITPGDFWYRISIAVAIPGFIAGLLMLYLTLTRY